jgi:hypothetical protein
MEAALLFSGHTCAVCLVQCQVLNGIVISKENLNLQEKEKPS